MYTNYNHYSRSIKIHSCMYMTLNNQKLLKICLYEREINNFL